MNRNHNMRGCPRRRGPRFTVEAVALGCIAISPLAYTGCYSGPSRVEAPKVDPVEVAKIMIDQYDLDGDSLLSKVEIANCPAVARSLKKYDANSDSIVGPDEIAARLQSLYKGRIGLFAVHAHVTVDGQPLPNATVEFIPEKALGGTVKNASGMTNSRGIALMAIHEEDMPSDLRGIVRGVQTGLYRIQVTAQGRTLPSSVENGKSLGAEVSPADSDPGIHIEIES